MPELPNSFLQCVPTKDIPTPPNPDQIKPNDPDWVAIAAYMRTMESKLVECAYVRDYIPVWWEKQKKLVDQMNIDEEKKK